MTRTATAGRTARPPDGSREITAPGQPVPGPPWLTAVRDVVSNHPLAADLLLAAGLLALVGGRSAFEIHLPLAKLFSVLLCAPLVWRRRYPLVVFGFQCVVALTQWTLGYVQVADVALLLGLYTIAAHRSRHWAVAAAGVLELGVLMSVLRWWIDAKAVPTVVFLSGMVTAAFVLGVNLRTRRAYLASLEDRALRAEFERDQQSRIAAAGERARIAREMHDIVAHNLSVMIALADGAAFAVRTGSPQAELAARQVSDTGRQALAEMQRLLGVLRDDDGTSTTTRAPQPGIEQLDDLIAQVRATGLAASLTVSGQPFPLPTTAQLAVYRVVQEALTNVLKHATAPTRARVTLCYEESELRVDIIDDGGPADGDRVGAPGHGLAGMRERAALFGGEVAAGPLAGGGWKVALRMAAEPSALPAVLS